ncbi:MAG: YicC family protein, partial [Gammaproteobacteria bacterium]|nr:YicC family protein [Gammaproteobacteria bacterium]
MTQSMTAFARQEMQADRGDLSLELRSVNHRFLEISLRLPEELRSIEPLIRECIGKQLNRGKVDCNIRFQSSSAQPEKLELNRELASHLAQLSREVDSLLYDAAPVSSLELLKWPGVLQAAASDISEQLQSETVRLLDSALTELIETRLREGEQLQAAIEKRVVAMAEACAEVRQLLPQVKQHFRERLAERLTEIKTELDEGRVEQEIVLFAQKIDVDEEL